MGGAVCQGLVTPDDEGQSAWRFRSVNVNCGYLRHRDHHLWVEANPTHLLEDDSQFLLRRPEAHGLPVPAPALGPKAVIRARAVSRPARSSDCGQWSQWVVGSPGPGVL